VQSQTISWDEELLEEEEESLEESLTGERDSQLASSPQVCLMSMLWKPLALCSPEVCTIEWPLELDEESDESWDESDEESEALEEESEEPDEELEELDEESEQLQLESRETLPITWALRLSRSSSATAGAAAGAAASSAAHWPHTTKRATQRASFNIIT
jgi:hypothetical protein